LARIAYSERAFSDLEPVFEHFAQEDPRLAVTATSGIQEAVSILDRHPLIGRPVEAGLRELVISRGKTGFVVLYRYLPQDDAVLILALRHQRELGYPDP
jgi:plasmid stabilization system protein ParE